MTARTLAILLSLGLAAPGAAAAETEPRVLTLATGGIAGVYFPLGEALADVWSTAIAALSVEAEPTGGSVANVAMLQEGDAELALVQNDIAHYAATATEMFAGEPPRDAYRGLAMLYPEPIQIVTLADSDIAAVADLAEQRVAVGAWGSGTEVNARQILEAHGLSYDDIHPVFLSFDEAAVALRDGLIHAAFLTAGTPTGAVVDLIETFRRPAAIVPLDPERVAAITERWPHYAPHTIAAGTYPGIDADTPTVTVLAMLVAAAELAPDTVEALLERLYAEDTLARLCATHARGCDIARDTALEAMPIPLHPGAEAFFARGG